MYRHLPVTPPAPAASGFFRPDGVAYPAVVPVPTPMLALPGMAERAAEVEQQLLEAVSSENSLMGEMASHLILAGGKRVRPLFAVVSAATRTASTDGAFADDNMTRDVVLGGVAVELVHLGSLYHDDVIDEAVTRRTVESVNARWGNLKAILAGDFLLAKASEIAASLGTEVAGLLAATIGRLCEGEVKELQHAYDLARTEADYTAAIEGKTASLFATACRIGGIVGELPRDEIEALTSYGLAFGMAFQVIDDVLDVVATDEELGKPAGHDIAEGVYNLPVIRALKSEAGDRLRGLLGTPLAGPALDEARELVRTTDAVDEAVECAEGYVATAVEALASVQPGPASDALAATAHHLLTTVPR